MDTSEDPSEEELAQKLSSLTRLVQKKKTCLLANEICGKEIALRNEQAEDRANIWQASTQDVGLAYIHNSVRFHLIMSFIIYLAEEPSSSSSWSS